ncbi:hypothetical protein BELL_0110g00120 [Botrytis elliptica]|uniref:Uncharacterized protein n=1 Tax=Botrytis elliptica TaxID=278938 RepID=A0A4Z1JU74_9HELO|nr:hypothetical protein BELL_0110g00120 [Botrytis elliptica]
MNKTSRSSPFLLHPASSQLLTQYQPAHISTKRVITQPILKDPGDVSAEQRKARVCDFFSGFEMSFYLFF